MTVDMDTGRQEDKRRWGRYLPNVLTAAFLIMMLLLIIWAWRSGVLDSQDALRSFISGLGWRGPVVYTLLLTVGTVFPVFPNPLIMGAGIVSFTPWPAFCYNWLALVMGSVFIFILARRYGQKLIVRLFGEGKVGQWVEKARTRGRFDRWFFVLIVLPLVPDDLLCYIAGLTDISWRRYMLINIIGRPWTLLLYSAGLSASLHI